MVNWIMLRVKREVANSYFHPYYEWNARKLVLHKYHFYYEMEWNDFWWNRVFWNAFKKCDWIIKSKLCESTHSPHRSNEFVSLFICIFCTVSKTENASQIQAKQYPQINQIDYAWRERFWGIKSIEWFEQNLCCKYIYAFPCLY